MRNQNSECMYQVSEANPPGRFQESGVTLALTLALSPGERGQQSSALESQLASGVFSVGLFFEPESAENLVPANHPRAAHGSPSPGGEGRGEGGRYTNFSSGFKCSPAIHRIELGGRA